ncbi:MAG: hypothetical protein K6G58_10165 [Lachnospiraceae bacterium]|nr:hypothetical protein [Lachnospiraceae bacterium]
MDNRKYTKAIFILTAVFHNIAFHEYGLDCLSEHGYEVEVWIVGGYDKRTKWDVYDKDCDLCKVVHVGKFCKYEQMVEENSKDTIFILATLTDRALLYPICRYDCAYFVMGNRVKIPSDPSFQYDRSVKETFSEKVQDWLQRYSGRMLQFPYIWVKKTLIGRENRSYIASHTEDLTDSCRPKAVFVTNEVAKNAMISAGQKVVEKCNVIYSNSRAYSDYLDEEEKGGDISEDFILCANSGLGFYGVGVYKCYTVEPIYQPEENAKYLKQIETMLDRLEDHYGIPAVIANHPRCDLRGYDYGGRQIINGKTCELSKKCKVFVTAITSAIAYPVFYNKDILFFYNDCIKNTSTSWGSGYVPLMKTLGLTGLNLDEEKMISRPWEYVTKLDPAIREKYLEEYHYERGRINKRFGEVLYDAAEAVQKEQMI